MIRSVRRTIEIVPATLEHCAFIARNMKQADRDEVMAASGFSPMSAIKISWLFSLTAFTGLAPDGEPLGMFGVSRENINWFTPWLLSTERICDLWIPFLRTTREMFPIVCAKYPNMRNHVDARNVKSIAWLQWLGFNMEAPAPYGVSGLPFILFYLEGETCVTL